MDSELMLGLLDLNYTNLKEKGLFSRKPVRIYQ